MFDLFEIHKNNLEPKLQIEAMKRLFYRTGRVWHDLGNKQKALFSYKKALRSNSNLYRIKALFFTVYLYFTHDVLWKDQ
jgi:hypothetical protein